MNFGRFFDGYYAPRRKRKSHAALWIAGAAAFVALMPLAVKCDKKKGEWGVASLLVFVGGKPSAKRDGKKEITIALPGFPYVKSMAAEMISKKRSKLAGAVKDAGDAVSDTADDIADGLDELLEDMGDNGPEVVITEE